VSRKIIAIRQAGGTTHQHIIRLWWIDPATGLSGDNSRTEMVGWIEVRNGKAYVEEYGHRVDVLVVTPTNGEKYLRTRRDGVWTDNLLALPRR
jgi:hypothetical protein